MASRIIFVLLVSPIILARPSPKYKHFPNVLYYVEMSRICGTMSRVAVGSCASFHVPRGKRSQARKPIFKDLTIWANYNDLAPRDGFTVSQYEQRK